MVFSQGSQLNPCCIDLLNDKQNSDQNAYIGKQDGDRI